MRAFSIIPALSTLTLLLGYSVATPLFLDEIAPVLEKRCANPCGYHGWLCCRADQACSTNSANQALCLNRGGWKYFTTTIMVTNTDRSSITSVWSSHIMTAAPAPTAMNTCRPAIGETPCGNKCCGAQFVCDNGECVESMIVSGGSTETATTEVATTEAATPPVRGTSNGMSTVTQTAGPTTTQGFIAPVGTNGAPLVGVKASGQGLSGGAIAGIVIGTIAGVIFLLLFCACVCFKEALDGLLSVLGFRNRKRKESTYVEERYSHHSGSRPQDGRTWFGTRPEGSEVSEKKPWWRSWATVGIILGTLALCLGLKRHRDREYDDDKTDYTYPSTYYDYYSDYYTNPSTSATCGSTHRREHH